MESLKMRDLSLANFHKDNYSGDLNEKIRDFYAYYSNVAAQGKDQTHRQILTKGSPHVQVEGINNGASSEMLMLASNNYLGLSAHPEVTLAARAATIKYGNSCTGSPILNGMTDLHRALECKLASYKAYEDCILYPSGFSANMGAIAALVGKNDIVFIDKLCHASIIDGVLLSGAKLNIYPHLNMEVLEKKLQLLDSCKNVLVITDGIFSMDGDVAPLDELVKLKRKYQFRILVDDAHATGVIGKNGKGTAAYFNVENEIDYVIGTLSKSLGGNGGFLVADTPTITYLRFYSRSYFYSASLPPSIVGGVLKSLEIIENHGEALVKKLQFNAQYLRNGLKSLGLNVKGAEEVPIIPIIVGNEQLLSDIHEEITRNNIFTNAVPYPAVPKKECRIRLSVMASHSVADLDKAIEVISKAFKKHGLTA